MDGNTDIQKMASNFAGLTQARLSSGGDIKIPLAQELQYAKFYIELQQMRFGNKISYHVSVSDEALLSCLVPKLTLEMLVENAVGHGIEPKEGPGTVRVSVGCTENGALELVVTDDGVGMTPEQLATILEKKEADGESSKIGVCNVNERLQLFFGPDAVMKYYSTPGVRTMVMLVLPIVRGKEEDSHAED